MGARPRPPKKAKKELRAHGSWELRARNAKAAMEKALLDYGTDDPLVGVELARFATVVHERNPELGTELLKKAYALAHRELPNDALADICFMISRRTKDRLEDRAQWALLGVAHELQAERRDLVRACEAIELLLESAQEVDREEHVTPCWRALAELREHAFGEDAVSAGDAWRRYASLIRMSPEAALEADPIGQAETAARRALAIYEKAEDDDRCATALDVLVQVVVDRGQYGEALDHARRSLALHERGGDPRQIAKALSNLCTVQVGSGDRAAAITSGSRAIEVLEKAGLDAPADLAHALNNLAGAYVQEADYARAEPLFLRALAAAEQAFGVDHPDVAATSANLAFCYHELGHLNRATHLLERSLNVLEAKLGPDHPRLHAVLTNLSTVYADGLDLGRAEVFAKRALELAEKTCPADHPDVITSLVNLGAITRIHGDLARAEALVTRALGLAEASLGSEHPQISTILDALAEIHADDERHDKAIALHERAVAIAEKHYAPDHPHVALVLNNLSTQLMAREGPGDLARARTLLERAIGILERTRDYDRGRFATTLENLAGLRIRDEAFEEAETIYLRALEEREKSNGTVLDRAQTHLYLGDLCRRRKEYGRARKHLEKARAIVEKECGEDDPNVAAVLEMLARLRSEQASLN